MQIKTLRTHRIGADESLFSLLDTYIPPLQERSIVAITSKIVSLCEGSVVAKESVTSKEKLIQDSADAYLDYAQEFPVAHAIQLTIKNNILIPSAGIDESNGNGTYILYPKDIQGSAQAIWEYLRKRDNLENVGVIITDSHTTPLRRGVIGIGLGWCGFLPTYSYIGKPDCYGVSLRVTLANHLDALAAATVYCMGEGNEQTPLAVITDAPKINFQSHPPTAAEMAHFCIPMEEDLYAPILKTAKWIYN